MDTRCVHKDLIREKGDEISPAIESTESSTDSKRNSHISPQKRVMAVTIPIVSIRIEQLSIVAKLVVVVGE